jgi:hypothetical protein
VPSLRTRRRGRLPLPEVRVVVVTLTGTITDDQARALAQLVAALRPGWDVAGIRAALSNARHIAPAHDLAVAAIRATQGDARTPAVIGMDGPHWHAPAPTVRPPEVRCSEPGHTSFIARNCSACRAENLEGTHPASTPERARDRAEIAARGAALAKAQIRPAPRAVEDL